MTSPSADFSHRVVQWQRAHGRHDLPWQRTRDPYKVWLSEVMLQQTQVSTVRDYYARFLRRFPDPAHLAQADLDEVLALWSGLGYYSRARNLHRCAKEVCDRFGGKFPSTAALLQTLPGIGRSTAAAIASFCFAEPVAILDGNVRRVLARVLGFGADLSLGASERALWARAQDLLPRDQLEENMPRYTQGLMDLGATVCTARSPACPVCPLADVCTARREGNPAAYPVKGRRQRRSAMQVWLLWARDPAGLVWLERRPPQGIWAGLHCLPAFESLDALVAAVPLRYRAMVRYLPARVHALTHKDLHLHPAQVDMTPQQLTQSDGGGWFRADAAAALGLPAPVRRLLELPRR